MTTYHRPGLRADVPAAAQLLTGWRSYGRPVLLVVAEQSEIEVYPTRPYTRIVASSAPDALDIVRRSRPDIVALDWDLAGLDAPAVCRSIEAPAAILVTTARPECAPAALAAGCDSILLKPLAPSLTAGRIGRLIREAAAPFSLDGRPRRRRGTNRRWEDAACPRCGTHGATSFEFSSHRRAWYACLSCEGVWTGPRRE